MIPQHPPESHIPGIYRLSHYQYTLPPELIAQAPPEDRTAARLMVLNRRSGGLEHCSFRDLPSLLRPSDLLVLNETRVVPAALVGHKPTGGKVELLVVNPVQAGHENNSPGKSTRTCLVRSSKRLRQGNVIFVGERQKLIVEEILGPGRIFVQFPVPEDAFLKFLDSWGKPPLPPYIRVAERDHTRDLARYQTIYSRVSGSVAAPTAGLHFTVKLLQLIADRGIETVYVVLHVGPGTFVPVRNEDIRLHKMETEYFDIPEKTVAILNKAYRENRRIIAVGTTTVRALESASSGPGEFRPGRGQTELFIIPPYDFKVIDGIVTNFHLPGSTLLMLISAFAGRDNVLGGYEQAIKLRYRFYSYGDACLII